MGTYTKYQFGDKPDEIYSRVLSDRPLPNEVRVGTQFILLDITNPDGFKVWITDGENWVEV